MGATLAPAASSGVGGLITAANPLLGLASGALGAIGQAAAGNAESGTKGNVAFGGIQIGSKVVGSGSATTVPPPENATQAGLYSAISPTAASSPISWAPLAAIAAVALSLVFLLTRKKGGK